MTLATLHLPTLCEQRIGQLLAQGGRRIVGVVAPPGAGKSTLATLLAQRFGASMCMLPMDGFHLANVELARLGLSHCKGAPQTFDAAGYVDLLRRVRAQGQHGGTADLVYAPEFRREIEEPIAGAIAVLPQTPLVVTEGNYLLLQDGPWAQVRQVLDEVWYLDTDDAARQQRLLARHMQFGRTREQALAWIASTDEPNARRIAATRHLADVCVPWGEV